MLPIIFNYYKNYVPKLPEKLNPFLQLLKTTDAKDKISITPELKNKFPSLNTTLDTCCQLALQQPLPNKQLLLMTDASFQAAGYAVPVKDDPNQKYTSPKKRLTHQLHSGPKHFPHPRSKCPTTLKNFRPLT